MDPLWGMFLLGWALAMTLALFLLAGMGTPPTMASPVVVETWSDPTAGSGCGTVILVPILLLMLLLILVVFG